MWTELDMCHLCSQGHPLRNTWWHASCIFNNFTFSILDHLPIGKSTLMSPISYAFSIPRCLQSTYMSYRFVRNFGSQSGFSPSQAGLLDQIPQQHHETRGTPRWEPVTFVGHPSNHHALPYLQLQGKESFRQCQNDILTCTDRLESSMVGLGHYKPPTWPPKIVTLWVIFGKIWPQLTKRDLEGQPIIKVAKGSNMTMSAGISGAVISISKTEVLPTVPLPVCSHNHSRHRQTETI